MLVLRVLYASKRLKRSTSEMGGLIIYLVGFLQKFRSLWNGEKVDFCLFDFNRLVQANGLGMEGSLFSQTSKLFLFLPDSFLLTLY